MKQTAVEWLVEQLKEYDFANIKDQENYIIKIQSWVLAEKIEQAKEMDKEQIIEAASNNSAKEAYRAGQDSMYCGCYEIDECTNYEEWIYKKQTNEEI